MTLSFATYLLFAVVVIAHARPRSGDRHGLPLPREGRFAARNDYGAPINLSLPQLIVGFLHTREREVLDAGFQAPLLRQLDDLVKVGQRPPVRRRERAL